MTFLQKLGMMSFPQNETFNMHSKYMLDTNICIYIAKNKPTSVLKKFNSLSVGDVCMSIITYGELLYGAQTSSLKTQSLNILHRLTGLIEPIPMHNKAAKQYAELRVKLEKKGLPIGNNDLWIASHALAANVILVTNNQREFSRIPGLQVENWIH